MDKRIAEQSDPSSLGDSKDEKITYVTCRACGVDRKVPVEEIDEIDPEYYYCGRSPRCIP